METTRCIQLLEAEALRDLRLASVYKDTAPYHKELAEAMAYAAAVLREAVRP